MRDKNLIRIKNPDREVYRIFPLKRIQEMFATRELVLVKPRMWEDPFENFLLRRKAVEPDGVEVGLDSIAESWYGLCWTFKADSDAMWRIYSPEKGGVRVKTTIRKLAAALWEPANPFSGVKYFIGEVQYWSREQVEDFLSRITFVDISIGGHNDGFAETLLIKREEFRHENEVRILAFADDHDKRSDGDLYRVPIDPHELIDEICVDPRLDEDETAKMMDEINALGYRGPVSQSALYKLKVTTIRFI